jgi:RNA polymerase sigma factor (TIGR02999 family)
MSDVTPLLDAAAGGDPQAAAELLPLIYGELRRLAAAQMADEKPGQTLQATGLVQEAYLCQVGGGQPRDWDGRGHFFAAAAEALWRILVESARRKGRARHGGGRKRLSLADLDVAASGARVALVDRVQDAGDVAHDRQHNRRCGRQQSTCR